MKIIGITGGVGAGKSTVLSSLKKMCNCEIIMADDVAKKLMNKGNILSVKSSEDTRNIALDKVYDLDEEEIKLLTNKYEIVKIYEESSNKRYRILTREKLNSKIVKPTIEDGYLCMIKEI